MAILNRVKELREERMRQSSQPEQWTQESIARKLGVTRQTVISMEKGTYNPSLALALKLARVFGVAVEEIFDYRDDENDTN